MIKAILFDFAGVIGADGYWIWLRKNFSNIDEQKSYFMELSEKVDKGTITNEEFVSSISERTRIPKERVWPEVFQEIIINDHLLSTIRSLKKHYKVGLLSNFTHVWLDEIFEKHDLHQYFDEIYISSRHGHIKPEAEAFQKILNMLQINKEESIFIDDRQPNVDAGSSFGIKSLLYTTNEQLIEDLEKLGITL